MDEEQSQIIQECSRGALTGELTFPDIIGRLGRIGVERYHADYTRQEITYYFSDGASLVVAAPYPAHATAAEFSPLLVEEAVGQSQRNEHTYLDFVRKTKAAGCVGYVVQIVGCRVNYFGSNGDSHVEHFPPALIQAAVGEKAASLQCNR